ncbi:putative metal-dependent membrane protease [Streptococcus pneumoniae]|nr:putative metal-dependent membrane protease [Streptococcus pneumoniae]
MKKIISHRYFIIVFLLVIADQKFSVLVLRSDLVAGLSDFAYYLSDMMLNFLVVLFALIAMIWSGKWQKINSRKFKGSYLFYSFLALLAFVAWNFVTFFLFPPTRNENFLSTCCSYFYRSYGIFDVFFLSCDCRSHF